MVADAIEDKTKHERLPPQGEGMDRGLQQELYKHGGRRCQRLWSAL